MKRLQIGLSEEAWEAVATAAKEANENFSAGSINFSDVINEMILNTKIDVKTLQIKHTDLRRSLRIMANNPDLDLDFAIKTLTDLKSKSPEKQRTNSNEVEEE